MKPQYTPLLLHLQVCQNWKDGLLNLAILNLVSGSYGGINIHLRKKNYFIPNFQIFCLTNDLLFFDPFNNQYVTLHY